MNGGNPDPELFIRIRPENFRMIRENPDPEISGAFDPDPPGKFPDDPGKSGSGKIRSFSSGSGFPDPDEPEIRVPMPVFEIGPFCSLQVIEFFVLR